MCERFPWLVGDGAAFCSAFLTGRADPLQITAFQDMVIRAKRMQYSCGIALPEGYRVESYRTEISSDKGKSLEQLGQKRSGTGCQQGLENSVRFGGWGLNSGRFGRSLRTRAAAELRLIMVLATVA